MSRISEKVKERQKTPRNAASPRKAFSFAGLLNFGGTTAIDPDPETESVGSVNVDSDVDLFSTIVAEEDQSVAPSPRRVLSKKRAIASPRRRAPRSMDSSDSDDNVDRRRSSTRSEYGGKPRDSFGTEEDSRSPRRRKGERNGRYGASKILSKNVSLNSDADWRSILSGSASESPASKTDERGRGYASKDTFPESDESSDSEHVSKATYTEHEESTDSDCESKETYTEQEDTSDSESESKETLTDKEDSSSAKSKATRTDNEESSYIGSESKATYTENDESSYFNEEYRTTNTENDDTDIECDSETMYTTENEESKVTPSEHEEYSDFEVECKAAVVVTGQNSPDERGSKLSTPRKRVADTDLVEPTSTAPHQLDGDDFKNVDSSVNVAESMYPSGSHTGCIRDTEANTESSGMDVCCRASTTPEDRIKDENGSVDLQMTTDALSNVQEFSVPISFETAQSHSISTDPMACSGPLAFERDDTLMDVHADELSCETITDQIIINGSSSGCEVKLNDVNDEANVAPSKTTELEGHFQLLSLADDTTEVSVIKSVESNVDTVCTDELYEQKVPSSTHGNSFHGYMIAADKEFYSGEKYCDSGIPGTAENLENRHELEFYSEDDVAEREDASSEINGAVACDSEQANSSDDAAGRNLLSTIGENAECSSSVLELAAAALESPWDGAYAKQKLLYNKTVTFGESHPDEESSYKTARSEQFITEGSYSVCASFKSARSNQDPTLPSSSNVDSEVTLDKDLVIDLMMASFTDDLSVSPCNESPQEYDFNVLSLTEDDTAAPRSAVKSRDLRGVVQGGDSIDHYSTCDSDDAIEEMLTTDFMLRVIEDLNPGGSSDAEFAHFELQQIWEGNTCFLMNEGGHLEDDATLPGHQKILQNRSSANESLPAKPEYDPVIRESWSQRVDREISNTALHGNVDNVESSAVEKIRQSCKLLESPYRPNENNAKSAQRRTQRRVQPVKHRGHDNSYLAEDAMNEVAPVEGELQMESREQQSGAAPEAEARDLSSKPPVEEDDMHRYSDHNPNSPVKKSAFCDRANRIREMRKSNAGRKTKKKEEVPSAKAGQTSDFAPPIANNAARSTVKVRPPSLDTSLDCPFDESVSTAKHSNVACERSHAFGDPATAGEDGVRQEGVLGAAQAPVEKTPALTSPRNGHRTIRSPAVRERVKSARKIWHSSPTASSFE